MNKAEETPTVPPPEERDLIYEKVLAWRDAHAKAQDVRFFKMQLFDEANKLKKELWKLIEGTNGT